MSVAVRPADPEDAPAVRSVAEAAWWATYPGILDSDTIRDALADLYEEAFLRRVIAERDDVLFLVAERTTEEGDEQTERDAGPTERGDGSTDRDAGPTDRDAGPTDRDAGPTDRGDGPTDRGDGPTDRGDGPTLVGFGTAEQTWADEVEIHTLYVHPDSWGEGTGTALLDAVVAAAREAGADRLRCEVLEGNYGGQAFLGARGFDHAETVTTEVGEETVPEKAFEKDL